MSLVHSRLYNLPASLPGESPSSWITRSALSQGITVGELLDYLKIDGQGDVDLNVIQADHLRLIETCGLPLQHLDHSRRLLSNLLRSGVSPSRFLLSASSRSRPRYRFCAACFREQPIPYLLIDWRFSGLRYCLKHKCMLEERCSRCQNELIMPVSQISAGITHQGVAYLRQCMSCEADFRRIPTLGGAEAFSLLGTFEQKLMRNGQAILAALFRGHLYMDDEPDRQRPLSALTQLDRKNLLPHNNDWQTVKFLKIKLAERIQRHAAERERDISQLAQRMESQSEHI